MGVMADLENIAHSPKAYKLMLNALHKHKLQDIRGFAGYSLLWFRSQPNVLLELEKAYKKEKSSTAKQAIKATIDRIKPM